MVVGGIWVDEREMGMIVWVRGREWYLGFRGLKMKFEKIGCHICRCTEF